MTNNIEVLRGLVAKWRADWPEYDPEHEDEYEPADRAARAVMRCADELDAALAALSAQAEAQAGGKCENCGGDGFVVGYHDPYSRGDASSPFDMPCPECAAPSQPNASEAQAGGAVAVCCGRSECGGECGNEWRGTTSRIEALIVAMAENYEMVCDEGYYQPNEHERLMLVDFAHEVAEAIERKSTTPPAKVPEGWVFETADFSMVAAGTGYGLVRLRRDKKGFDAWLALNDEDREVYGLYVFGNGMTLDEAFRDGARKISELPPLPASANKDTA